MEERENLRRDYTKLLEELLGPWGLHKVAPRRFRSCCPIHKGTNRTTFSITEEGRWTCFAECGFGDMADLISHLRGITKQQARKVLENFPAVLNSFANNPLLDKPPVERRREVEVRAYEMNCPRYLLSRGFSREFLRKYGIGYDTQNRKIVIPVRSVKGDLVGITYRADKDSDDLSKYWHDGFIKSDHLWGLDQVPEGATIFLVEGQLDVVRMRQLGHYASAVMGSSTSEAQAALLINSAKPRRLVLAFDNDAAGVKAKKTTIRRLVASPLGRRLFVANYPTSDPGDLREYHHIEIEPWHRHM